MRGTGTVTDLMVASYLARYSTKGTEVTGHASKRRSILRRAVRKAQARGKIRRNIILLCDVPEGLWIGWFRPGSTYGRRERRELGLALAHDQGFSAGPSL